MRQSQTCPTEETQPRIKPGADMKQTCIDLMATATVCTLTTIDDHGFPHTTAMNNLRCVKTYPSLVQLHAECDNDLTLYNVDEPELSEDSAPAEQSQGQRVLL